MAKITDQQFMERKIKDAIKSRIRRILTPQEFRQVKFTETGTKLKWEASKEIQEKIDKGLKTK